MTKKPGKIGGKGKVGQVTSTEDTSAVKETGAVGGANAVGRVGGIGGVGGTQGVRKRQSTRVMSAAERQAIFDLIKQEADSMMKEGLLSKNNRAVVEDAVKMAVDLAIVDEDEK